MSRMITRFKPACAIAAIALGGLLVSCGGGETNDAEPASKTAATKPGVDMVITGGAIYTNVDDTPNAEAVAIDDGLIVAVGPWADVEALAGSQTRRVELGDAALYPGFVDGHAHFIGIGERELTLNLEGVSSIEELVDIVSAEVLASTPGEIIIGRGWIETGWPENRFPNRLDFDAISPDNPVILVRADGHALVANSATLAAANLDRTTPNPDGGRIEKDAQGEPTGILVDNAMSIVEGLVAVPDDTRKAELFKAASDVYASYGWTGIHNMSVDPGNVAMMERLSDDGAIAVRLYNAIGPEGLDGLIESGARQSANGRVVTRGIKMYIDGALGSRGAALSAPYSDAPDTDGLLLIGEAAAKEKFTKAAQAGLQVSTHAIGDRANKLLLNWYADIKSNLPESTNRWRDEHTQILHVEDIPRFAELGVIASMQPSHAIGDLYFAPDRLGPNRLDGAYAWRSLIDAGAIIAGGSDAPVERGDPMIEFYAAVARKGLDGFSNGDWHPEQAVTRAEALKMFTSWNAYAAFQEDQLGTIEVGKKADLSIFSTDIMAIPEAEILDVTAVMTLVDGEVVYEAE